MIRALPRLLAWLSALAFVGLCAGAGWLALQTGSEVATIVALVTVTGGVLGALGFLSSVRVQPEGGTALASAQTIELSSLTPSMVHTKGLTAIALDPDLTLSLSPVALSRGGEALPLSEGQVLDAQVAESEGALLTWRIRAWPDREGFRRRGEGEPLWSVDATVNGQAQHVVQWAMWRLATSRGAHLALPSGLQPAERLAQAPGAWMADTAQWLTNELVEDPAPDTDRFDPDWFKLQDSDSDDAWSFFGPFFGFGTAPLVLAVVYILTVRDNVRAVVGTELPEDVQLTTHVPVHALAPVVIGEGAAYHLVEPETQDERVADGRRALSWLEHARNQPRKGITDAFRTAWEASAGPIRDLVAQIDRSWVIGGAVLLVTLMVPPMMFYGLTGPALKWAILEVDSQTVTATCTHTQEVDDTHYAHFTYHTQSGEALRDQLPLPYDEGDRFEVRYWPARPGVVQPSSLGLLSFEGFIAILCLLIYLIGPEALVLWTYDEDKVAWLVRCMPYSTARICFGVPIGYAMVWIFN